MKLSKLYSNRGSIFAPVEFSTGFNVVLAEIRLPQNRKKDTHNLGKTTLGRLIDFCLLAGRDPHFFLLKYPDLFSGFVFFLEVELLDGGFLTIRRTVDEASKASFKRHNARFQSFVDLSIEKWDHSEVPLDRARDLLDGTLDLRALTPWSYRKGLGYLLRSQDDYRDVFQLRHGHKHVDWKPFLAHQLGFDSTSVEALYRKDGELTERNAAVHALQAEIGGTVDDASKIEGMLLLKQKESEKKQALLDSFDFRTIDKEKTKVVVDDIDGRIAALNSERYTLGLARKKITTSLEEDDVLFNPEQAEKLFAEVGVTFPGQLKKDYQQLIAFNRAISDERRHYLTEERTELDSRLKRVATELNELGKRRSELLSFLKDSETFKKYRQVSEELVALKADILSLERQRGFLHRLQEMRSQIRQLTEEKSQLQAKVERDVEAQNANGASLFSSIRVFFSEIVDEVIDRKALLSVSLNQNGHLEFRAEILDEAGKATSADLGHTYRKLLCVAFDMAVLRAHLDTMSPRFVFHDGVFESLDDRKKLSLVGVMREYAALGIQFIITLIDSELPEGRDGATLFIAKEVILRLHDEGADGRLFRMNSW